MRAVLLLVSALVLAGCAGSPRPADPHEVEPDAVSVPDSFAVVGLQDNGINVYHATFRDPAPRALQHPSTYIPGYPEDAKPLDVTLDAPHFWAAVKADCESVWSNIELGQLYYVPGTKIIGAITFEPFGAPDCSAEQPNVSGILASSHGTMTASRAAGVEYGACKECRIVMVEGFNTEGVQWLGDNSHWVDVQSHSWGPVTPAWVPLQENPAGVLVADPLFVQTVETAAQKHMALWAAGNGAAFRWGLVGHPTLAVPHMGPSVVIVGGHDSGYINTWPGFWPHVISDSCNSWAAHHTNMTSSADSVGGGTSGATPFAAGIASRILLEARTLLGDRETGVDGGVAARGDPGNITSGPLADGELTLQEWKELVFRTASPRPERQFEDGSVCSLGSGLVLYDSTPVMWKDVPPQYPEFIQIGYGAADNRSKALAMDVLRGTADIPDRSVTDQWFAMDRQARLALHQVWAG